MDYVITYAEVTAGYSTDAPQAEVELNIEIVDEADACMEGAGYSSAKGKMLKILAVRHLLALTENNGSGVIASQSAPSGASQAFQALSPDSWGGTTWGQRLASMDAYGCVTGLISGNPKFLFLSVGPAQ